MLLEEWRIFGFCLFLFSRSVTFLFPTKSQSKKEVLVKCKNNLEHFLAIPEGPRSWIDRHGIQNYEGRIKF